MLILLFAFSAMAQPPAQKMDLRELSRNMAIKGSPDQSLSAPWVFGANAEKEGVTSYRYMHAMVNAATFAKEPKELAEAAQRLSRYECENWLACEDYSHYLDGALEKGRKKLPETEQKKLAEIRQRLTDRAQLFSGEALKKEGLCSPHSRRSAWLEQEYSLLCPTKPGKNHLCPKCLDTNWLKKRIDWESGQMLMSSAYLKDLKHEGSADCRQPWKVSLICDGTAQKKYILRCERKAPGVRCKE